MAYQFILIFYIVPVERVHGDGIIQRKIKDGRHTLILYRPGNGADVPHTDPFPIAHRPLTVTESTDISGGYFVERRATSAARPWAAGQPPVHCLVREAIRRVVQPRWNNDGLGPFPCISSRRFQDPGKSRDSSPLARNFRQHRVIEFFPAPASANVRRAICAHLLCSPDTRTSRPGPRRGLKKAHCRVCRVREGLRLECSPISH